MPFPLRVVLGLEPIPADIGQEAMDTLRVQHMAGMLRKPPFTSKGNLEQVSVNPECHIIHKLRSFTPRFSLNVLWYPPRYCCSSQVISAAILENCSYWSSGGMFWVFFYVWRSGHHLLVGTWFWWTKFGLHVQAWKPHVQFGVLLSKVVSQEPQYHTEVWKPTGDTSFNYHWSPWAPWPVRSPGQYKACSPPLLSLSSTVSSRGAHRLFTNPLRGPRAAQPISCNAAGCPAGLLTSSLLIQLYMEESCSFQLISPRKPPRNTSSIIL